MERTQFTFYRSYYDAITVLPKKDQSALLLAICAYALDEEEPALTGTAKAIFALVRPTLDASRKKAESGKVGGEKTKANDKQNGSKTKANDKQNGSKTKANDKQNGSKTKANDKLEIEQEIEQEIELEIELEIEQMLKSAFDAFWEAYPKKSGKGEAKKAFAKVKAPLETLLKAIEDQKRSVQWQKDGGQYIPNPATWLNQGRWEDELPTNTPKIGFSHAEAKDDDLTLLRKQLGM